MFDVGRFRDEVLAEAKEIGLEHEFAYAYLSGKLQSKLIEISTELEHRKKFSGMSEPELDVVLSDMAIAHAGGQ